MAGKLGKAPAKHDPLKRTIKFSSLIKKMPKVPEVWDYDFNNNIKVPIVMFANDQYGDCVLAGRAHQTLRFEATEQKKIIEISDDDVIKQYLIETGGKDEGLVLFDSLKRWRNGWQVTLWKS